MINKTIKGKGILMKTRYISLALAILFVLSILSACGDSTTPNASTTPGSSSSGSSDSSGSSSSGDADPAAAGNDSWLWPEPVSLTYIRPIWGDFPPGSSNMERLRGDIFERTNIDVELMGNLYMLDPTDLPDYLARMVAAGQKFDILYYSDAGLGTENVKYLADQGIIIPLDDLIAKYGQDYMAMSDPGIRQFGQIDGVQWTIPGETLQNVHSMIYRADWLREQGLSVPTTTAEWEHVAQVFQDEYNCLGFMQVWDMAIENVFLGSFVPAGNWIDTDGRLKTPYEHPNFKTYLTKLNEWYSKGYINKDLTDYSAAYDNFLNGRNGVEHCWADYNDWLHYLREWTENDDADFVIGPALKDPSWDTPVFARGNGNQDMVAISADCENPEAAFKYIMWTMTTWEGFELTHYGLEDVDILVHERTPNSLTLTAEDRDPLGRTLPPDDQRASGINYSTMWLLPLRYNVFFLGDSGWMSDILEFPLYDGPDFGVMYKPENYPSADLMTDANAFRNEGIYNIIMGVQPVDYWDTLLSNWLRDGGQLYTDGLNEEFNAWKAGR